MGWAPGKGLGAQENGTLLHIKAAVKTNQRGLGADVKTSDNWIDNTSGFSQLLAKLNTTTEKTSSGDEHADFDSAKPKNEKKVKKEKKSKKESKSSKAKRENSDESSDTPSKKSKKEKKAKKDKKRKEEDQEKEVTPPPTNLRHSHRARYVRNKKLSTSDPANLNAIFGVRG
ncbi:PIN2/TERF1-interacting telomerase inhibitor 1 [Entomophthora muscae]|uniref:PIN2/TERF1-interacting telomerase inhibitor 1 n=1 Tax=Entomophthora muscae TaxID=34485 RepID=A0ACC2U425_9FUNG|nr:PIN2/TERF1-interacting telomerase inhibitor 1 [Entomophthora muscae]